MAKISPVAAKYIVHSTITIDGIVDRPDVIGAIFGQTEGLLGSDLELRELQRSGRVGRIEVNLTASSGKTKGEIIIPSSLDKTETAIVGAALEIIQRIGPCNAKVDVHKIEDVRTSKRQFVIERAKVLLKQLTESTLPDSQELADEVSQSVRMTEVVEYGKDRLAAGPAIDESEEIIIVEGRADVLNLLKHGFKNVICMNGTSCPPTIQDLMHKKAATVFVDGDRGGDLIIRELMSVTDVDFVCKAPDGKEVEELAKKEIHKALRGKITAEQCRLEQGLDEKGALKEEPTSLRKSFSRLPPSPQQRQPPRTMKPGIYAKPPQNSQRNEKEKKLAPHERIVLKQTMEDLLGTRGACIFDNNLQVLGKVPLSELTSTMKSLNGGIFAVALDGQIDVELVRLAEKLEITHLVGTEAKVQETGKVQVSTDDML